MGLRAYGWTARDTEVVDTEAAELRRAAREIDAGKSVKQVIRELNDRNIPTAAGNKWAVTSLSRTLVNPRMIGRNKDVLGRPIMLGPLVYPPIFSTDDDVALWKRVRAKLLAPSRKQSSRGELMLMSGHMECSLCDRPMFPTRPKQRKPRYACHVDTGCGRMSITAEVVETHIAHELVERAARTIPGATPVIVAAWWNTADLEARRELLEGFLDKVRVLPTRPGHGGAGRLQVFWKDMPSWPAGIASAP